MLNARNMGIEVLRALCVLALIFLSFAHTPVTAAAAGPNVLTATLDMSYCGDLPGDPWAHAPCHACRIGSGATLPPPCGIALAATVVASATYGAMPSLSLPATAILSFNARGPPVA